MADRSHYEIVSSDGERRELEHRAAGYSRPHREVDVGRMAEIMYPFSATNDAICADFSTRAP
jgi:hypothetical protein